MDDADDLHVLALIALPGIFFPAHHVLVHDDFALHDISVPVRHAHVQGELVLHEPFVLAKPDFRVFYFVFLQPLLEDSLGKYLYPSQLPIVHSDYIFPPYNYSS
jgi:hypothetical protein